MLEITAWQAVVLGGSPEAERLWALVRAVAKRHFSLLRKRAVTDPALSYSFAEASLLQLF